MCVCECVSGDSDDSNKCVIISVNINIYIKYLTVVPDQRSGEERSDTSASKVEAEKEGGERGDRGERRERSAEEVRAAKDREEAEYRRVMQPLQYDETPQLSRYHFR